MSPLERRERLGLALLLTAYVVLAVGYSAATPLYESTDELRHVRYVRHIATYGDLPVQRAGAPRAQSHHPPLYYAVGALVTCWVGVEEDVYYQPQENPFWAYRYWEVGNDNKNQYIHGPDEAFPYRGITLVVYLLRWTTVLIGVVVVWLTYEMGREIFSHQPSLALASAALVAFIPQFLHLSGSVGNDVPAAACGAAVLLNCVLLTREDPTLRRDVMLGILMGLSLLTKLHLMGLLAPVGVAYVVAAWPRRDWRAVLRAGVVIGGLAAILSGWWFLRNWRLYGDPTGLRKLNELWAGRDAGRNWWVIGQAWPYLWTSLWGRFGYGQIPLPRWAYRGFLAFTLLGVVGHLVPRRSRHVARRSLLPLVTALVIFFAAVTYYMLVQPAGAMGRFLFPVLPAVAVLLVGGLAQLVPQRLESVVGMGTALAMMCVGACALLGVLRPAFAAPRSLGDAEIRNVPNRVDIEFGGQARLLGYEVTPRKIDPGETVEVTLYWQPLARTERNYAVFIHLMSEAGTMIAQRDTHPGLGRYPTTAWDPGGVFADTYRLQIPDTAYAPDEGYVQVGMYLPDGPRLLTGEGQDTVRIASVTVNPRSGELPNPLEVNFGDKVALAGYALDRRAARLGETIHVTLYWRALSAMEINYNVFVHVLGDENQIWARTDSPLTDEGVCTNRWEEGALVREERELVLAQDTPPGFYDLELGVYTREQGRLNVLADDGRSLGSRKLLTTIRVMERHD